MLNFLLMLAVLQSGDTSLVGTWQLVAQDGVDKLKSEELLHFYPNGDLLLEGNLVYKGKYETKGDELITILTVAGEKKNLVRKFKLADQKLSLAIDKGFGHYKKIDAKLPDFKAGIWRKYEVGYFKLEAPADWSVQKDPAHDGSQRMVFQEPSGNSALTLMRIPGRGKEVDLSNALKGVIGPMLQGLDISNTVIQQEVGTFNGRVGTRLEAVKELPEGKKLIVHTFGQKLEHDSFLVILYSFVEGSEATLNKIVMSLKTPDDPDLKTAEAELAKELAALKAAAEEAEKNHAH